MNKTLLIGRLGADPEIRYLPDGTQVATLSLATSERYKDKQTGDRKEKNERHRCVAFGRTAEVAGEYLRKGSQVYIGGQLRTRKWTDNGGIERYTTEIVVREMEILGSKPASLEQPAAAQQTPSAASAQDDFDDDITF